MKRCDTCGKRIWWRGVSSAELPKDFDIDKDGQRIKQMNLRYNYYHNNIRCDPSYEHMRYIKEKIKSYDGKITFTASRDEYESDR